jgi:predicted dithiol-disulfide oxidoreductase (DUF899 family)
MTPHLANGPAHPTLSRDAWTAERLRLLAREKAHLRESDQLARERRALPWLHIDKRYVFDTPEGPRALADLFDGRSQLLVQHFMFAPVWEAGCPSCSFMADHIDAWAGSSAGSPRMAAISISTCTSPSRPKRWPRARSTTTSGCSPFRWKRRPA